MVILLSLDPGGTTGWSLWRFGDSTPMECLDHGMIPHGLRGFKSWWENERPQFDTLIVEDFIEGGGPTTVDRTPVEIIHWLETIRPPNAKLPNTKKANATNEQLKRWGWWWPGAGHDRDSARHAVAHVTKTLRHMPTLRALWPPREDTD